MDATINYSISNGVVDMKSVNEVKNKGSTSYGDSVEEKHSRYLHMLSMYATNIKIILSLGK